MADASFYDRPTTASLKKHRIVSKYFAGWANIVLPAARAKEGRIWFVDLFSGPGTYKDGTESIPLLVLRHAINTPALHDTLQVVFNDENKAFIRQLQAHVQAMPGIECLQRKPAIRNRTVSKDLVPLLTKIAAPTLFFADPWGYQGVSLDLLHACLTHWGSDFMFFFNYNRINMNLSSDLMREPIDEFFTSARAEELRKHVATLRPAAREQAVLDAMKRAIAHLGARSEKFTYRSPTGSRTTHHLMCVSRSKEGIALFKEISAKESSTFDDNVPSLDHNPAADPSQPGLFPAITRLEDELVTNFAGRQITTREIYHEHHNGKPYVLKNYRQALLHLESAGKIAISPPREMRRSPDAIPGTALITFPIQQAG